MQYLSIPDCLPLALVSSCFIHVVACIRSAFYQLIHPLINSSTDYSQATLQEQLGKFQAYAVSVQRLPCQVRPQSCPTLSLREYLTCRFTVWRSKDTFKLRRDLRRRAAFESSIINFTTPTPWENSFLWWTLPRLCGIVCVVTGSEGDDTQLTDVYNYIPKEPLTSLSIPALSL